MSSPQTQEIWAAGEEADKWSNMGYDRADVEQFEWTCEAECILLVISETSVCKHLCSGWAESCLTAIRTSDVYIEDTAPKNWIPSVDSDPV